MSKVIVAICAYNVEETLEKTIAHMPAEVADEVILVDDGSSDRTVALGEKLAEVLNLSVIVHPENRGYGAVQKTAYSAAVERGADVVALLHGDFQYDPASLPLLVSPLLVQAADMTFGSRFAASGDPMSGGMPLYRFVGNRITTVMENVMIGTRFTDMHSGMRAFNRKCLLSLPFLSYRNDFAFDKQTTVDAVMGGLRVLEIPIPTRYDHESSSIPTIGSFRYVWHSLVYTARTAGRMGRRGRRWEVMGRPKPRLAESVPSADLVWELASSYIVPERSLAVSGFLGAEGLEARARGQGWDPAAPAGLVVAGNSGDEALQWAASTAQPEGLVLVVSERDVRSRLGEHGLRLIGWHDAGIAIARRDHEEGVDA